MYYGHPNLHKIKNYLKKLSHKNVEGFLTEKSPD